MHGTVPSASFALEYMLLISMTELTLLLDYLEERHGEAISNNPRFARANLLISLYILWKRGDPSFFPLFVEHKAALGAEGIEGAERRQALESAPPVAEERAGERLALARDHGD